MDVDQRLISCQHPMPCSGPTRRQCRCRWPHQPRTRRARPKTTPRKPGSASGAEPSVMNGSLRALVNASLAASDIHCASIASVPRVCWYCGSDCHFRWKTRASPDGTGNIIRIDAEGTLVPWSRWQSNLPRSIQAEVERTLRTPVAKRPCDVLPDLLAAEILKQASSHDLADLGFTSR